MHIILSWCISVQLCKSFKLEFYCIVYIIYKIEIMIDYLYKLLYDSAKYG